MPPIAATRSGHNIRRACSLASDVSPTPTAASGTPTFASGKSAQLATPSHPKNSKLYKTELCRTWMDCGRCNYGEKCQYAHGEEERRPVLRHPKYKTAYCQPFHQIGYCSYGSRCHFIHNEEPSLQARQNQNNCNSNTAVNGTGSNNTTTTTLTFGIWQPYCSSTGESPVSSSAGSSSDSPIGSTSPSIEFDDSMGSLVTSSWNAFGGKLNSNLCCFNWPTSAAATATTTGTPQTTPRLAANHLSLDSAIINDLLDLTLDEKKPVTKVASEGAVTAVTSGRLPVFAQLSNPSSAS